MRVTCPCCMGQFELEAALNIDAARSALVVALSMPASIAVPIANYLACFRPKKRALSPDRLERLLLELLPMLAEEYVIRDGLRRECSLKLWTEAFQAVQEARAQGELTLPLESHGYLLTIAARLADKAGAKTVREGVKREASKAGDEQVAFYARLSRISGDLELGLITEAQATEQRAITRREFGR